MSLGDEAMGTDYDMDVDYETLCQIEIDLMQINSSLDESTKNMVSGLQDGGDFLAGRQFEKAKSTTLQCLDLVRRIENKTSIAINFVKELKKCLEEYSQCIYEVD